MTSNARRPGFRIPWLSDAPDDDQALGADPSGGGDSAGDGGSAPAHEGDVADPAGAMTAPSRAAHASLTAAEPQDGRSAAAAAEGPRNRLLREMVDAMRSVAEHARDGSLADVRRSVEQAVGTLRAAGGQHAAELRRRAEDDIAAIEESARAEAERIRREAEARIAARRDQLEHDLAVEASRTERDIDAIQARVADYERELSHFFAGLREVGDPAAFAAAVRRMPTPPGLAPGEDGLAEAAPPAAPGAAAVADAPKEDAGSLDPVETAAPPAAQASGVAVEPREETADGEGQRDEPPAGAPIDDFTQVIVQGLGSFGAITAFKQSLERSEGIGSVALSLGPTGEFVYRATHSSRFDIEAAISELEGGTAELRRDPDGTLRVIVARG